MKLLATAAMLLVQAVYGAPVEDKVESLPGMGDKFPYGVYSGYLPVNGTGKQLHYMFLES